MTPLPSPSDVLRLRRRTQWLCLGYLLGMMALALLFRHIGEEHWALWFWMFLPLGFWLLPLLALGPMAWRRDRRMLAVLGLGAGVLLLMSGWRWQAKPTPGAGRVLTLVSYNIGENNDTSVVPFLEQQQPDLLLLQCFEPKFRAASRYRPADGAKLHTRLIWPYEVQSRYPISSMELIRHPKFARPIGAVIGIDWEGVPVTVFSVHLPTPRAEFMILTGKRKGEKPLKERAQLFTEGLNFRSEVFDMLLEHVRKTEGPVIVAGDFNMPAWGRFYQRVSAELTDTFIAAGRGFGLTFPGHDPYFPTPLGPWLRLDYIFCNARWRPLVFTTERGRESQHLAIFSALELIE